MEGDFLGKEAKGTCKNMFLLSEQNHIYIKNTKRLNLSVEPYEIENETDRKWNWFTNPVQNADRFDLLIVCNLMSSKSENNY